MDKNYNIFTDEEMVKMAQEGSSTAAEHLIAKYKELAKVKSTKYYIIGGDKEDVVQEGMIGIFKAIREFDETKEASFKTFAEICINRQIISAIRKANMQKHQILNESVSLSQEQSPIDGNVTLEEMTGSTDDNPESLMLMREIVEYLRNDNDKLFSPMEKKVLDKMLQGKKYKEIATELGKSDKSVDNAIQRIKKKIYNYMGY